MKTLLQIAKEAHVKPYRKPLNKEDLEISLAWLNDEVSTGQILAALGKPSSYGSSVLHMVATSLKKAIQEGLIEIKVVKTK